MTKLNFEMNEEELNKESIEHSFNKSFAFAERKEVFTVDLHLGAEQQYETIYHPNHLSRLSYELGYKSCHTKNKEVMQKLLGIIEIQRELIWKYDNCAVHGINCSWQIAISDTCPCGLRENRKMRAETEKLLNELKGNKH